MGVLSQALEIILEVQRKRINEKITRRKISFSTYKTIIIIFGDPLLLPNLLSFLIFIHLKQFEVLCKLHLEFYKSSLNSNSNKANIKGIISVFGNRPL
jgi:hypothetical protein